MGLSLQDRVAALPAVEREAWLATQPDRVIQEMLRGEWWWVARPEQIPPAGDWFVCLALAGRGYGKSRAGSEWIVEQSLKHPYDNRGTPTEWLVVAETLSDARTICMDGPAGIIQVLERRKVRYRYKMSPRPMVLFPSGTKIYTEGADNADVGRGYSLSGAWLDEICIAKDEPVVTARGSISVQDVIVGDRVMTRRGWRPVTYTGLTQRDVELLEIRTAEGTVRVTPDHRVWSNGAWRQAQDVAPGDTLATCPTNMKTPLPASSRPTTTGTESAGTSTSGWSTTSTGRGLSFIVASGPGSMARSRRATRSITSTASVGTIGSKTSSYSLSLPIASSLSSSGRMLPGTKVDQSGPARGLPSIGRSANLERLHAQNVAGSSSVRVCGPSSVATHADRWMDVGVIETSVLSVVRVARSDVYDITVEGEAPEFFAGTGAILVHNCKWKTPRRSWGEGIMPSLRADLVGDHPRAFVTTTPKPIDILQEWVKRDDGTVHVIRGSTFDNKSNLSTLVVQELRRRYEGTIIGRQELYGEIIESFDGALFTRLDIENNRMDDTPDSIMSIVVGVDPSLTGEDDEMGIVVCARDRNNHLYILADRSIMAVGRAAALEAWRVAAEFGADKIICETNLGKKWMQQVFNDAYYELVGLGLFEKNTKPPIVGIDTKIGKRTRGEPVAMRCEQGKLHCVGHFPQLEDQMATFTSWGSNESPDRLDAMVHACRFLMDAEKHQARISSPREALSSTLQSLWQEAGSYSWG